MVKLSYTQKVTISFLMNQAARWLKAKREADGLSYRELGKAVGLAHQTIADAEEGKATTDTWMTLAEHYHESVLRVLYWAKKMKQPPSDNDVVLELQNRLTVQMLEQFPQEDWEGVLKRLTLEVDEIHERQQRNNKTQPQSR